MKPAMGLFRCSMRLGVRCTGASYDAVIDPLLPSDGVAGCVAQGIWGYVGGLWSIASVPAPLLPDRACVMMDPNVVHKNRHGRSCAIRISLI